MAVHIEGSVITDSEDEDVTLDLSSETPSEEFTGCIVYCPVCATNDDANSWGLNVLECGNCLTRYVVQLLPAAVHEHSMVG